MNAITTEWDKCYPKNEKVNHKKVSFKNHFGIELVADYFSIADLKKIIKYSDISD